MITIYQKTLKDKKIKTIDEFKPGSWLFVESPTEEELGRLASAYSLEPGLLHDAIDPHEVPRMEIENEIVYIFMRVPHENGDRASTVPFLVTIGNDFVLTLSEQPLPIFAKFMQEKIEYSTTQKMKLVLQILFEINALYHRFLNDIHRNIRSISINMDRIDNKNIIQFVTFENVLNDFISALVPMNDSLHPLLHGKAVKLYEEDEDLIEDFILSNNQLVKICSSNIKMIVNIRSAYSTIMTNNLSRIISFLTVLTIVLTVPMITTGLYGMNVRLPLENSPHAFWLIAGITGLVSLFLLGIFVVKRWI